MIKPAATQRGDEAFKAKTSRSRLPAQDCSSHGLSLLAAKSCRDGTMTAVRSEAYVSQLIVVKFLQDIITT